MELRTYQNSTPVATLHGVPIYVADIADACLRGKLNLFLQGDTGSGKSQLITDVKEYFGQKALYLLGRNDMDTRELFQRINPEFIHFLNQGRSDPVAMKELTERVQCNFVGVDELPNCVPAVRAQLFNLFDGYIEIEGKPYPLGNGYCIGMAAGNIGQQFTESSNDLGRALRDRMHLMLDVDYFFPSPADTYSILRKNRNPRVSFEESLEDRIAELKARYYLRYVDDLMILHRNVKELGNYRLKIDAYIRALEIELHPEKSRIVSLKEGVTFLGYRNFYHYRLLKKSNVAQFNKKLSMYKTLFQSGELSGEKLMERVNGWFAYAMIGNTHGLRKSILKEMSGWRSSLQT